MSLALRLVIAAVTLLAGTLAGPAGTAAQNGDELRALRQEIEAMRKQLQAIEDLLRGRAAARPDPAPPVTVAGAPVKGDPKATLVIVEFSDYECPFCGRSFRETHGQLDREYIRTGKVRYVFRDFPLEHIHPHAAKAAEAARCAGDQGKYWEMHDRLFAHQSELARPDLSAHAGALALDVATFDRCVDDGRQAQAVKRSFEDGRRIGVDGTPTFFIGRARDDASTIAAAAVLVGSQPYEAFKQALDRLAREP